MIEGKKVTFIVMPALAKDKPLVAWVLAKKKARGFKKTCRECGIRAVMGAERCLVCGKKFPVPTKKVQVPVANSETVRCGECGIEGGLSEKCAVCGTPYREVDVACPEPLQRKFGR